MQSARLDGRPLERAWITHEEIVSGGTFTLVMWSEPNKAWGSGPALAPPAGTRPVRPRPPHHGVAHHGGR
ncbi:hypothetical protein GCM10018793_45180 [Streptomyces sulfonofaciens]|uniref:Uncharacterized protein n=1 Tax=Streptomyces sulfonofaciens TaxID=68272 RepID=A0A919GEZ9_9ACTN|nr:hypothetical protein GCM10018793_45180 [Streptomyces sulfonofaciens]